MTTPQNPLDSFIWGPNGSIKTPEDIARDKQIAEKMLMGVGDTSPVGDWTQGAARVVNALGAVIRSRRAQSEGTANADYNTSLINALPGGNAAGSSTGASAASSSSIPMSGAANQISNTAPGGVVAPTFAADGTELGGYLSDPARRATLPAGMRNNNPGNIKFTNPNAFPGVVGPSQNTDQGDPQAVFATPEAGMQAMYSLLGRKYAGGKTTPNQMIAGNMGWTPGNYQAAANVARAAGIGPDDDIGFNDPAKAARFMQGLILQEHGKSGALYPGAMISSAIGGQPTQVASAQPQTATDAIASVSPAQTSAQSPALAYESPSNAQTGYADPQVLNVGNSQPAAVGQQAPITAASPPQAPAQQVAQAMMPQSGASAPPTASGMNTAIIRALTDPRATPQTRAIAQALLQQQFAQDQATRQALAQRNQSIFDQQLKQQDPSYQADLRFKNAQANQIINPRISPNDQANLDLNREKFAYDQRKDQTISPTDQANINLNRDKFTLEQQNSQLTNDVRDFNFAKQNGYQGNFADYQIALKQAGRPSTTINNGDNSSKFQNKADEEAATRIGGYMTDGTTASRMLGDVQQLADLGAQINTGKGAQVMATLGPYAQALGIDVKGLGEAQAYQAVIDRMAPNMRPTGAGSSSDTDVRMFLNSLPSLGNVPGGNQVITQTLAAIQQQKIAAAQIAQKAVMPKEAGGISWQEAEQQIRDLGNPYENFNKYRQTLSQNGAKQLPSDSLTVPTTIPGVTIRKKN